MLTAIYKNTIVKTYRIDAQHQNKIGIYSDFLRKHKEYNIIFLLDSPATELRHEIVPILQNLLKSNPVENFITNNFDRSDVVAYNVYNISNQNGEIWEVSLARTPCIAPFKEIIEYVISHSYNYSGTYFLPLEFEGIVDAIIKKTRNSSHANDLQVFACVTKTSGIRICIKHKKDILDEVSVEYPHDKSDEYIQGTIEQIVEDKILAFKDYIASLGLKTSIIILCDAALKNVFAGRRLGDNKLITVTADDLELPKKLSTEKYVDSSLMLLFNKNKTHIGYNPNLHNIIILNLLNSIIFKPIILFILSLFAFLSYTKLEAIKTKQETKELNNTYYTLSEEYRKIKQRHPEIQNVGKVAELYGIEAMLKQVYPTPFAALDTIYNFNTQQIRVEKTRWLLTNKGTFGLPANHIMLDLDISYKGNSKNYQDGIQLLNNYTNYVRTFFPTNYVKLEIEEDKVVSLSKELIIPAHITVKGEYEED